MSRFYNKTLCIFGGSGFLGQAIAREALKKGINVIAVSRSASYNTSDPILSENQKNGKYTPIHGDAHNLKNPAPQIMQADAYIHTIGTLIDTSITKWAKPGQKGTYEYMNRDALIKVAEQIENSQNEHTNQKKKLVYISASLAPPFIKRYKTTKDEASKYLLNSQQLDTTILEPGFVWSWQYKWWSLPLSYLVDIWAKIFTPFYTKFVPKNTFMHKFLDNFLVDRSIQLEDITRAAVYSAFNQAQNGQILRNEDMEKISIYYNLDIALNEEEAGQNQSGQQQMQSDNNVNQQKKQQQKQKEQVDPQLASQMQEQEDSSVNWVKEQQMDLTQNEIEKQKKLKEQKLDSQKQEQDEYSANFIKEADKDLTQNEIEKQQKLKEQKQSSQMEEMDDESANFIKEEHQDLTQNEIEKQQKLKEQKQSSQMEEMDDESANWIKEKNKAPQADEIDEITKQLKQKEQKLQGQMQEMDDESANWVKQQKK